MAMQLLGNLFEYELGRRGEAAQHPGRHQRRHRQRGRIRHARQEGRARLHDQPARPHERLPAGADVQPAGREHPQPGHRRRVRRLPGHRQGRQSNDLAFKRKYKIGTVNSINWARLLAQVVYYFAGYFQATKTNAQKVSFTVPAATSATSAPAMWRADGPADRAAGGGHQRERRARRVLPHRRYRVRGSADTHETSSPSMDISKASNFERFVFDLLGRDGARVKALFGDALSRDGRFDLSAEPAYRDAAARYGFVSGKSTACRPPGHDPRHLEALWLMIDTHTADGVKVAREHLVPGLPMIVLETACRSSSPPPLSKPWVSI
jgi:threonine synthase